MLLIKGGFGYLGSHHVIKIKISPCRARNHTWDFWSGQVRIVPGVSGGIRTRGGDQLIGGGLLFNPWRWSEPPLSLVPASFQLPPDFTCAARSARRGSAP
jgi:hypothetical protein